MRGHQKERQSSAATHPAPGRHKHSALGRAHRPFGPGPSPPARAGLCGALVWPPLRRPWFGARSAGGVSSPAMVAGSPTDCLRVAPRGATSDDPHLCPFSTMATRHYIPPPTGHGGDRCGPPTGSAWHVARGRLRPPHARHAGSTHCAARRRSRRSRHQVHGAGAAAAWRPPPVRSMAPYHQQPPARWHCSRCTANRSHIPFPTEYSFSPLPSYCWLASTLNYDALRCRRSYCGRGSPACGRAMTRLRVDDAPAACTRHRF